MLKKLIFLTLSAFFLINSQMKAQAFTYSLFDFDNSQQSFIPISEAIGNAIEKNNRTVKLDDKEIVPGLTHSTHDISMTARVEIEKDGKGKITASPLPPLPGEGYISKFYTACTFEAAEGYGDCPNQLHLFIDAARQEYEQAKQAR